MELNFATSCGSLTFTAKVTFLLQLALPFVTWTLMASHVRFADQGAWRGTGFYSLSLVPAAVGLVCTFLGYVTVLEGLSRSGAGTHAAAAGIAEALVPAIIGFAVSGLLAASSMLWTRKIGDTPSPGVAVSGMWMLSCLLAALLLLQAMALGFAILVMPFRPGPEGLFRGCLAAAVAAGSLAVLAGGALWLSPRGELAGPGPHRWISISLLVILIVGALITYVVSNQFHRIALGV